MINNKIVIFLQLCHDVLYLLINKCKLLSEGSLMIEAISVKERLRPKNYL